MASRSAVERWLNQLTHLSTAPGREEAVVDWVTQWVRRRDDLRLKRDATGNLLITQKGRRRHAPVAAVAHMDHPGFIAREVEGQRVTYQFLGGVNPEYFVGAKVEFGPARVPGKVEQHDGKTATGTVLIDAPAEVSPGDLGLWRFPEPREQDSDRFAAPACDDLAGVAASLAALDRARSRPELRHLMVLLTRGEEVGFLGAFAAARDQTLAPETRVLSIETSPELPDALIGDGPIIRVGDRLTIYDREMTNRISSACGSAGLKHQRKLMSGGACEATAFGVSGYRSTGLCVALGNHHNRGNLEEVELGRGRATAELEEISLSDFHGLVDLILLATGAVDHEDHVAQRLATFYDAQRHVLG